MLSTRSNSAVQPKPRERLFPWWSMLLFAVMVSLTLLLFFPQKWLMSQVQQTRPGDRVSLEYLANLVKFNPSDNALQLALVRQYLASGDWGNARVALRSVDAGDDGKLRTERDALYYRTLMLEYQELKPDDPRRAQLLQTLSVAAGNSPAGGGSVDSLVWLARQAEAIGQPALAGQLYDQLARTDSARQLNWLEAGARVALANGDYDGAARRYFAARAQVRSLPLQRHYFLAGLRTLQSGNQLDAALAIAQKDLGALGDDPDTLKYLIALARSANQLDLAAQFARRLLQMSWLREQLPAHELAQLEGGLRWLTVDYEPGRSPQRAFDEEAYRLGYEVFVASRKLDDAVAVAQRAVQLLPGDLNWRKRLAQALEWSGHPELAIEHWTVIAERGGSQEAWQALLRLAPGLNDNRALLLAQKHRAATERLSDAQWRDLAALYEKIAEPREGAAYLVQQYQRQPQPLLLELAGEMYQRAGDEPAAGTTLQTLIRDYGPAPQYALKLATLQYLRGDVQQAYETLRSAQTRARDEDIDYWHTLGELAWQAQQDRTGISAYRTLLRQGKQQPVELERLYLLLQDSAPDEAAQVAEQGWQQYREPRFLLSLMALRSRQAAWIRLKPVLDTLTADDLRRLGSEVNFWLLRSQYHLQLGQAEPAVQDARQAVATAPGDNGARINLLWLLIDQHAQQDLAQALQQWRAVAEGAPQYWDVYASGYLALNQPEQALPYFRRGLARHASDYLWLMGYADALEQAQQPDIAWRIRRHAWAALRQPQPPDQPQAMLAQARLALQFAPADTVAPLLRQLLRQDWARGDDAVAAQANELVLSWQLSTDSEEAARGWLWKRYATHLAQPDWAALSLALQAQDLPALDRLLAARAEALPVRDHIEALRQLGRLGEAQALAFDTMSSNERDDQAQQQLDELALQAAPRVGLGYENRRQSGLVQHSVEMRYETNVTPALRLSLELGEASQSTRGDSLRQDLSAADGRLPDLSRQFPSRERQAKLDLTLTDAHGQTVLSLAREQNLDSYTSLRLERQQTLSRELSLGLSLGRRQQASDSDLMQLLAMRDSAEATLRLSPNRLDYASIGLGWHRYRLQSGPGLGRGQQLNWEIGHRLRTEYPDVSIRLSGYHNRYTQQFDAAPADPETDTPRLLPDDSSAVGLNIGFGQAYLNDYTRGWRPIADIGLNHSPQAGRGYNWLLGMAGSVLGHDHLAVFARNSHGGSGPTADSGALGLHYWLAY
ncbi:tetratricopeptide repeat protein [Chitinivorax sp. PXF-14]|uniref:tetratricopeptide repeat protein n=1 Tax=Chitinivorax sp. PXF-14 TaxID=3230488 RepID=UPI003467AC2F